MMETVLVCSSRAGGGSSLTGRSIFTAWLWIGRVMMNMMSSTSMTSIRGVVFISPIGVPLPEAVAVIAMPISPLLRLSSNLVIVSHNMTKAIEKAEIEGTHPTPERKQGRETRGPVR